MAKLNFKYGAMNCGKSDSLIKAEFNYRQQGLKSICIKPKTDTKLLNYIISRTKFKKKADLVADTKINLRKWILNYQKQHGIIDVVFLDESQFLSPKQVNELYEVAKIDNISIIAYGLKIDFKSKFFPGSKRFFELSDNIEKLQTMCKCGSQAGFNIRLVNGKPVFKGSVIAIDGKNKVEYDSVCGECWNKLQKKK